MNSREDRAALAYGRIDQANEALDAARLLLETEHYRGAINRAYYAIFYGILGLLVTRELGTSSHSGALTLFSREFIKTDLLPRRLSKLARHAFDARRHVDYEMWTTKRWLRFPARRRKRRSKTPRPSFEK